ncbi:pyridoxal-phosphate dependent enzyme [Actinomadura sp. NPDC047616]|uniref:threonine ammonia-lyase n=1 Tax=Actinomadura sp. NPDC047616 TaxID=3155914 RepID=UPI0033EB07B2
MTDLSLGNIEEAARLIDPTFLNTPQFVDAALSRRLGGDTLVKVETLNPIRSFKGRGADYYLRRVPGGRTVVCASAGNFGQAIAYAGGARGVEVVVFAATSANPAKVARMRELGAEVILTGDDFDAAKVAARAYAAEDPARLFVEDGDEASIAEGAGTIGVELAPLGVGTLLVPVGNGALIAGVGRWLKEVSPGTKIIGVCAAGAPAMADSWRQGRPVASSSPRTAADGIAVREPVPIAVDRMLNCVDAVVLVDEEHIRRAVRVVRDTLGLLVEPAGAAGIAAALQHGISGDGLATIITGANLAPDLRAELTGTGGRAD